MKQKKFFVGVLLMAITSVFSTEIYGNDKLKGFVELQPNIALDKHAPSTFGVDFGVLAKVNDNFSFGGGIGLRETFKFNSGSLPIFVRVQAEGNNGNIIPYAAKGRYKPNNMRIMNVLQPFATVDLGLEMFYMQFHYAAQIGVSYELKNSHSLDLGVGYQRMYSDSNYEHETKGYNAMKISLGYTF